MNLFFLELPNCYGTTLKYCWFNIIPSSLESVTQKNVDGTVTETEMRKCLNSEGHSAGTLL